MAKHFKQSEPEEQPYREPEVRAYGEPVARVEGPYAATKLSRHKSRRSHSSSRRRRGSTRARRHHVWPWIVALVLVAVLGAGGVVAYRLMGSAKEVRADARTAMDFAQGYVEAAKTGDEAKLVQSAEGLSTTAHRMRSTMSTPEWTLATYVPVYGSDVRSARTLGDVLVDLSDNALVPLSSNSGVLELSNLMGDSTVNMTVLQNISDAIRQAEPVVARSSQAVAALPEARVPQLAQALESAREVIVGAGETLGKLSPMLPYLPELLGAGGQTRTYLVVASNVAEVHAVGGFTGIVGKLLATDGHISMEGFDTVRAYMPFDDTSGGATAEEIDVIGKRCDIYSGDHNCVLDYARAGQIYHDHWARTQQQEVDGVLSFDPVFLQYLLGLVGPVETSYEVTVDGTNAASLIMNRCLFWWEGDICDEFYKEVAEQSLHKVLAGLGDVDTTEFMETIGRAATEGRCLAWLANEGAENAVKQAGYGWELPHDASAPLLGVFANDWSVSKASYYLDIEPEVGEPVANEDGSTSWPVTVSFANSAERSLLAGYIPDYLTIGDRSQPKRSELDLFEQLFLTAPEGGRIEGLTWEYEGSTLEAPELAWAQKTYEGLDTWCCYVAHIDAGETLKMSFTVVSAPGAGESLAVRKTPVMPADLRTS